MKRILVTRTDRLGDVILATPVLSRLRELYQDAEITFLVQKTWMSVLQYGSEVKLLAYDPSESEEVLTEKLKKFQFETAYVLRDEKKVTRAVKRAGIPNRVGPLSTVRSFFYFNRGRFQKRSQCRMHEAEYNLDLFSNGYPATQASQLPKAWVGVAPEDQARAAQFMKSKGLDQKRFVVIHPGSSGSARYVKIEKLEALAQKLIEKGDQVVVSGGPLETELLDQFQRSVPKVILLNSQANLGLGGMAEVYRMASVVVAHGTGPLHLAAAVQTPTLAIFPPIFVLSEKRWGPLVTKRAVWVPEVPCPAKFQCRGPKCRYYDCMDLFQVNHAITLLESIRS